MGSPEFPQETLSLYSTHPGLEKSKEPEAERLDLPMEREEKEQRTTNEQAQKNSDMDRALDWKSETLLATSDICTIRRPLCKIPGILTELVARVPKFRVPRFSSLRWGS